MKTFFCFAFLLLTSACGNNSDQSGLELTVKNSIPSTAGFSTSTPPILTAYFCAPLATRAPHDTERCIQLSGGIKVGETKTFHVSSADLEKIHTKGAGKGAFEFSDDQQLTF